MLVITATNNATFDVEISDLGIIIAAGDSVTLTDQFSYVELVSSEDLQTEINNGNITLNGLSASDAISLLTLIQEKYLKDNYYTKTDLQTPGSSIIHWNNIVNAPSFGASQWESPVGYLVSGIGLSSPPASPKAGDVYVDSNNHYQKYDGSSWTDLGAALSGDRVANLSDGKIYSFDGSTWSDVGAISDGTAFTVTDDGDGKAAQYIYDSGSFVKIADVDFSGHLDGGPSKHKASEIDVTGTYNNLPTDNLENVISAIDTELTNINSITVSLDTAYQNGSTINATSGPVIIDRGTSTQGSFLIKPKVSLPSTGLQDGLIDIIDGILVVYDATRGKWLSVERKLVAFGKRGRTGNQYLNIFAGSTPSNNGGIRLMRDACITAISGQLSKVGTCTFTLEKNGLRTSIVDFTLTNVIGDQTNTLNIDVNSGDYLQGLLQISGNTVNNPTFLVEIAWRF